MCITYVKLAIGTYIMKINIYKNGFYNQWNHTNELKKTIEQINK